MHSYCYVDSNGNGPNGAFNAADLKDAKDSQVIESGRGKEGGYYITGEKPDAVESDPSLKGRMVAVLENVLSGEVDIDLGEVENILNAYKAELVTRKDAQAKARANKT